VDPFLRYLLVLKSIEFAGSGDSLLQQELAPLFRKLNDDEIDRSIPWMDPKTNRLRQRESCSRTSHRAAPIEPFFNDVVSGRNIGERSFARRFAIGWLEKKTRENGSAAPNGYPRPTRIARCISS